MTDLATRRRELVSRSMGDIKKLINDKGVNLDALDTVSKILVSMAKEKDMFSDVEFPSPEPGEIAKIYLITDDEGGGFSLYLISVMPDPHGPFAIHDHDTFAVIAGLEGDEENTIYKRLDDRSEPGKAKLEEDYKVTLCAGDAIAFMPEDIHCIEVTSKIPTRHFHLYGKGFDQQTNRLLYDLEQGTTYSDAGSRMPVDDSRRVI